MLPFIINVICAGIVVLCLILCLLAYYELIHGLWFMAGLIVGCTVFFGTISANIYAQELRNKYQELVNKYNGIKAGQFSYSETNGNRKNTTGIDLTNGVYTSSSAPTTGSKASQARNTSNTTVNFSGIAQLANMAAKQL